MVIDMNYWTKVLKKVLLFILTLVGLFLSFKLAIFYIPFLIAFIISLMLEPAIRLLMRKFKLTRKISAIIIIALILGIIISLLSWGIATIVTEGYSFLGNIGIYVANANSLMQRFINSETFKSIPNNIIEIIQNMFSGGLENITIKLNDFLRGFLEGITQIPTIGIYLMVTFLSLYLICSDKVYMIDQMEHHLPERWVRKLYKHIKEIVESLGGYLKAELTLVLISFVICLVRSICIKYCRFQY